MKVAAIISEYNPFHNGHMYQIERIKELLGEDTAIIAIMSGNFTQRGELAIADKTVRAEAAVMCGINLVLELPFPYSMSSAEFFARAGVWIADRIGVVDYLVFGSEVGEIAHLKEIADIMSSQLYSNTLSVISNDEKYKSLGYPELCEITYNTVEKRSINRDFFKPNNILSIEYLKALSSIKSNIQPITIKRYGSEYNDESINSTSVQSATAIRAEIATDKFSALDFVPKGAKDVLLTAKDVGKFPSVYSKLDTAIISYFRLNSPIGSNIHDASGGLYNRLCTTSAKVNSISSLITDASTKKYTAARIRRAIWNSYFGVTSSDVKRSPSYTQVLAMDEIGCALLRKMRKMSAISIITKPSSYKELGNDVIVQKELCNRADSIFALAFPTPYYGSHAIKFTPFVKK